jgi:hypothetical protein
MCTVLTPPVVNPIAVKIYHTIFPSIDFSLPRGLTLSTERHISLLKSSSIGFSYFLTLVDLLVPVLAMFLFPNRMRCGANIQKI